MDGETPARPPAGPPLAFVADLEDPRLDPGDHHHLARVLRVADGQEVTLADGAGRWRLAAFGVDPTPTGPVLRQPQPDPSIGVAFAPTKGDRPDWVVQKLTELGVDRIVVVHTARSVVRWDGPRAARHLERLRRIAREAAMQCRRADLPLLEGPVDVRSLAGDPVVSLAVPGEVAGPSLARPTVVIGPEGGWEAHEIAAFDHHVGLSSQILRAETAALAAAALLTAQRAGFGP